MPIGRVIKSSTIPSRTFLEQKGSWQTLPWNKSHKPR
jgi:hypothetical protein